MHFSYTNLKSYQTGQTSFVPNLLPQQAVRFPVQQTLDILNQRYGTDALRRALDPSQTIASPRAADTDSSWLKRSNMVGINVRTIGSFFNVVSYALTLPTQHDSIHLLPIWEPGVVGSLYGIVSWQLNPEFFSSQLRAFIPALDTVEKQLRVAVNLLHLMGRTVGMDVIPHTDRFSEMVLAYPRFFEWVHRSGGRIINHTDQVNGQVEEAIWQFLQINGAADGTSFQFQKADFFAPDSWLISDKKRHQILFGKANDYAGRLNRRLQLIQHLVRVGYETLPMTMAPPYRGLHINADEFVRDEFGQIWYQYVFNEPQAFSRVFGPLARYRFYESRDNNVNWQLDFDRPNVAAWEYIGQQYAAVQQAYNLDFMRGDMAHVQLRPDGVPAEPDLYYDPLRFVKHYVQRGSVNRAGIPYFGFFAETFLAPPDTMGYGNEPDHLDAIDADSTLGDLQSCVVGSEVFTERLASYHDWLKTRRFAPNFTVMTADKDDPRFDEFYRTGNLARYFIAFFLTDMPSYVGLGFEVRNQHEQRGLNEEYTKLYVFRISDETETDKVTHGPFVWGRNLDQFAAIHRIRAFAEQIWPAIAGQETQWLVAPGEADYIVWTQRNASAYVFAVSLANALPTELTGLPTGDGMSVEVVFEEPGCRVWRVKPV